jgi:anti-sigma factor RsiW
MRGPLAAQDLTNYALNELDPHERIYVESLLATSEECRHDICQTIEMARLLEQGYEREIVAAEARDLALNSDQRAELTRPHYTGRYILRDVAAALALAACVAVAITKFDTDSFAGARFAVGKMGKATNRAVDTMNTVMQSNDGVDLAKALASLREMAEEGSKLIPVGADMLTEPPAICTPPTVIMQSAQLTSFGDLKP